jgi:hypothetical protein
MLRHQLPARSSVSLGTVLTAAVGVGFGRGATTTARTGYLVILALATLVPFGLDLDPGNRPESGGDGVWR